MINEIWTSQELKDQWADWIQFRKEKKWKPYVPTGLKASLTELKKLSGGDEKKAIAIIQQSMAGKGWQGFWPLKEKNGNKSVSSRAQSGQEQLYSTAREFINGGGNEDFSPAP